MTDDFHMYRHAEITCHRPYGVDVDEADWLWEGCGPNRIVGHNLRTAEVRVVPLPEMEGHVVYDTFAWGGWLVLTLGSNVPYYLVVDVERRVALKRRIPAERPIVWYGTRTPGGKVLLFERSESKVLILDSPLSEPRAVQCPYDGELAGGSPCSDGLVYTALCDPLRLVRFDPANERFVDETAAPFPESSMSGRFEHDGVLYGADSARGRMLPYELETGRWLDPVPVPGHGEVFGFIGAAFGLGSKGYFCLSTYAHRSRLDPKTGQIILPDGPLTVDGRPPRFMERYLVFDAASGGFDYLVAPEQPDGVPLLCYNWTDGKRFAITGIIIPFDEPGVPGTPRGEWVVLQNVEAEEEPGLGPHDLHWDRAEHLRRYRRTYPSEKSLYLDQPTWCPPTVNMRGPGEQYSPGKEAELKRRAARTDERAYWSDLAARLLAGVEADSEKVKAVCRFIVHAVYYNPIQAPDGAPPIGALESHDARCGAVASMICSLLEQGGVEARKTGINHHVVAEAHYDGAWHLADALFFGDRQPEKDGHVLSVDALKADPYVADSYPQDCFDYDPELLMSEDGYQLLGYCFGPWGAYPFYSYYVFGAEEYPPTVPIVLPAQRTGPSSVRLRWAESAKRGGGDVEYDVRVFPDRDCGEPVFCAVTDETSIAFNVPEENRMYFVKVRAMDDHRTRNPDTWYATAKGNFVFFAEDHYGWYGVL